jgi:fumarate reductase subunit C
MQKIDIEARSYIRKGISVEKIILLVLAIITPILILTLDFLVRYNALCDKYAEINNLLIENWNLDYSKDHVYWFGMDVIGKLDDIILLTLITTIVLCTFQIILIARIIHNRNSRSAIKIRIDFIYLLIFILLLCITLSFILFHNIDVLNEKAKGINKLISIYNENATDSLSAFSTTYLGIHLPTNIAIIDIFLYSQIGLVALVIILIYLKMGYGGGK